MRILVYLAVVLNVAIPAAAVADPVFYEIPPWQRMTIYGVEYACYDFEAAKELKLADAECHHNREKSILLEEDLRLAGEDLAELRGVVSEFKAVIDNQGRMITDLQTQRDEAILEARRAEVRDILGGGLPWVIATAAVCFAGGMATGYYLARK